MRDVTVHAQGVQWFSLDDIVPVGLTMSGKADPGARRRDRFVLGRPRCKEDLGFSLVGIRYSQRFGF